MTHTRTRSYWIWQVTALAIMVALVTLGILIGRASASPTTDGHKWAMSPPDQTEPAYRFRAAGTPQVPATMDSVQAVPPFDGPKVDNVATVIYNHFGNPAAGQAMIQTSIRNTQSDLGLPANAQGQCRAVRVHRVVRISLRCELFTFGGTDDDHAVGPTANNGNQAANPRVFLALTPTILTGGTVPDPQLCGAWSIARYAIRWDDGTISEGKVLTPPATWANRNCDVIP